MQKVIILDRDGVINVDSKNYIKSPAEWQPLPGSLEAICNMNQLGYTVAIATNQSGIGRGLFSIQDLAAIHQKLLTAVTTAGGKILKINYCPHIPADNCLCRKPKPGLLLNLFAEFNIQPKQHEVFFVGDALRDLQAAQAANCQPILLKTGVGMHTMQILQQLAKTSLTPNQANAATKSLLSTESRPSIELANPQSIPVFADLAAFANSLSST